MILQKALGYSPLSTLRIALCTSWRCELPQTQYITLFGDILVILVIELV